METIHRDFSPQGVKFYYLYKALAHPEHDGYIKPVSLEERLLHVKEAERTLGSRFTWLCDTMANDLKHALGNAPNSEFILDPDGKIARMRVWSDPAQLRKDLEELVGPVEKPTTIADLDMQRQPPPAVAASGVVPRLQINRRAMIPLKLDAGLTFSTEPFYVKLRAEAARGLMEDGYGKLYLGFHLDPIYHVHWNNLVDPIEYEIESPTDAITVVPKMDKGPQPEEPSDIDPREFLVDVFVADKTKPMKITLRYYACNDEEGWCKPVTQTYRVHFEEDPDAGWVQQRNPNQRNNRQRQQRQGR